MSFYRMERGWMDHDAFRGEPYGQRAAWVWLIERAAWKPTRHLIGGKFVPIGRGQLAGSLRFIAGEWGWGHERVRRFLKLLASDAMIETNIETGKFIITICNYNKYQAAPGDSETPRETRSRQQRDSSETLKNEGKEVEEESPRGDSIAVHDIPLEGRVNGRRKARHGFPADWLPDEQDIDYAHSRGRDDDWIGREGPACRDLHIGKGTLFADYHAAWRTWVHNAERYAPVGSAANQRPGSGGPGHSRILAALDRVHLKTDIPEFH